MSDIFMVSVGIIDVLNRDNEVICSGKTLLDSAFEKDTMSGEYIPLKKIFNMGVQDVLYHETQHPPYPEKAKITCQIVSMDANNNGISHIYFTIDNLHLYNSFSQVEKILKRMPAFSLKYNDEYREINK